ncbi:TPA: FRG domain-containing protein [Kluyvera ascorbata]|uniref:FRG domain-containing protein n=1 Tax=Kluyvera ascorbata TaxID=51288 RepID=UPI0028A1535E|nr:FRG domain-containing protein [Kluyvera ascorbata]HED3065083.1 FRG domain-containing protein [Kluyvera ascorbata]
MGASSVNVSLGNVNTVTGYLRLIFKLDEQYNDYWSSEFSNVTPNKNLKDMLVTCFRGQADARWNLSPSIFREYQENAESLAMRELMIESPDEFNNDRLMFDKLVRAQHYGLPTRLLDVSLNPLVALYFACCEFEDECDGKVYIIGFKNNRVKFSDSDTISLISNLARLNDEEKKVIKESRGMNNSEFRKLNVIKRLVNFVQAEKSFFSNSVIRADLFKYFFVYPSKNNKRVVAQSGAFISSGVLEYTNPGGNEGIMLLDVTIPAGSKGKIKDELDKLNINSRSLFPEIEFASHYIKKKYQQKPKQESPKA